MITRTFRAPDMLAALEEVQRALGPEALIASVRQVPGGAAWQVWKKPEVEVVAMSSEASPQGPTPAQEPQPAKAPAFVNRQTPVRAGSAAAEAQRSKPILPHTSQIPGAERRGHTPTHLRSQPPAFDLPTWPPALTEAYHHLVAQGVDASLAQSVTTTCAETLGPRALEDGVRVRRYLQQQLEAGLLTQGRAALADRQVVCLIGSSGSGKTTTAAKLAAYHASALGRKVAWICADTLRAGAISQARIYAEALKLPLRVAYTPDELAQAVAAEAEADLILVDMPGCNPHREEEVVELGALLTALPRRATYLIAPATAKDADLAEALAAFGPFHLTGLVLTKLDETSTLGSAFNTAWRSRLPMAYFTTGPRVLDDLQPAHAGNLVNALWGGRLTR